jgi:hypothetical protein
MPLSVPTATVLAMDGTGYPLRLRDDGTVVETAPTHCPNGHRLGPGQVGHGPSPKSSIAMLTGGAKPAAPGCGRTAPWRGTPRGVHDQA